MHDPHIYALCSQRVAPFAYLLMYIDYVGVVTKYLNRFKKRKKKVMQVWVAKGFVNPLGHQTSETEIGGGWRWVQSKN